MTFRLEPAGTNVATRPCRGQGEGECRPLSPKIGMRVRDSCDFKASAHKIHALDGCSAGLADERRSRKVRRAAGFHPVPKQA